MSIRKSLGWAVALAAMALPMVARAESVTFITSGEFSATAPSDVYTDGAGHNIAYMSTGTQTVDLGPTGTSTASFGQFNTSLTSTLPGDNTPITGTFTLTIFQIAPDPSPASPSLNFIGSLSGTLTISNSASYIQFDPSSLTGAIGNVFYSIVSADDNHPGRVNLAPLTTNGGLSNIAGRISAVPEPSTLVLMGIGAPALLAVQFRRKRNANVAV